MTKNLFSTKTFILTIILVLSFIFMQNAWFFAAFNAQQKSYASTDNSEVTETDITSSLSNSDFTSTTGSSSFPRTPASWKVWKEDTSLSPAATGVIDLTDSVYKEHYIDDYKLGDLDQPTKRNGLDEQSVLMINNGNLTSRLNYGYKNTTDLNLASNSFYSISTYIYTSKNAHASIYLTGTDVEDLETSAIENINASGWQEATIYIATGSEKETTVGIELFIGQKSAESGSLGYVLFDNISIKRYSQDKFDENKNTGHFRTVVDLRPQFVTSGQDGFVTNGDFTSPISTGWTQDKSSNSPSAYITDLNKTLTINNENVLIGDSNRGNNLGLIVSAKDGFNSVKSDDITIKQYEIYKISFWAKGALTKGNINFSVKGNLPSEVAEETPVNATISTLATDAIALNNNWAQYKFYIVGNSRYDSVVNLYLGIGTETADATGYIAIANIQTEKVNSAHKDSNTANSATLEMEKQGNLVFTNGTFNSVNIDTANQTMPYSPKSWTKSNTTTPSVSGVVNINETLWNNSGLPINRPIKNGTDTDNVLMIYNPVNTYQSYSSTSTNFATNGYAKISVDAYVQNLSAGSYAYITIKNNDKKIIKTITLENTDHTWKTYEIYLHNYYMTQDLNLELSLGQESQTAFGSAFFDNCEIDTTITKENFDEIATNATTFKIDLEKDSLSTTDEKGLPTYWIPNEPSNEDVRGGIVDARNYDGLFEGIPTTPSNDTNKILYLNATTPSYYYYASNLGYKFVSGTYYKVSVMVRTVNIPTNDPNQVNNEGMQIINGANISIKGIDQSFSGINTAKDNEPTNLTEKFEDTNNAWSEYIIYINTTTDVDGVIQLGLGSASMPTTGYAFFANLSVTTLTEDAYKSETTTLDKDNLPNNILMATNTPKEDEKDNSNVYNPMDWFAIPTIIIAIAVIVAVVGFFIKKFYRSRPKKSAKINTNYDRLQTLLKDVDRRERKTAINHKLKLLHEELEQSKEFLKQETEELKRKNEAYNTAKEIAQDNPTVELELPDVKQIEKSILIQENKIEQIELDIEILNQEKERIEKQAKKDLENIEKKEIKTKTTKKHK